MNIVFTLLAVVFGFCSVTHAGLITHTDYTAGNVITAAGQNSNENAIVNEINGNLDSDNIENGGIITEDLADNAVTNAKLATNVQSTVTVVNQSLFYRRPVLVYVNSTAIDIQANTSVSNQTCIMFGNEQRCVTENTSSTSVNRRLILTEAASNSATKNSGMVAPETRAANTWYAVYAWKVSDNSTDFVLATTTNTPSQSTYSQLDNIFGGGAWVYLGLIRNGDNATASSQGILTFKQSGAFTLLQERNGDNFALALSTSGAASSVSYTYVVGTSSKAIPSPISIGYMSASSSDMVNDRNVRFLTATQSEQLCTFIAATSDGNVGCRAFANVNEGFQLSIAGGGAPSKTLLISLVGWIDDVLDTPFAPRL